MSLTAAKQVVDGLLDGQSHSFSFSTPEEASAFITAAEGLGAVTDAADASDEMPDEPNP